MNGDKLAAGAKSATFFPVPNLKGEAARSKYEVEVTPPRRIFGECRDCGGVFYSAAEFCAHSCIDSTTQN